MTSPLSPFDEQIDLGPTSNRLILPKRQLFKLQRSLENSDHWNAILEIDNSSLEQFNVCSRSAQHYLVDGRETSRERSALTYGTAIHNGLEPIMAHGTSPDVLQQSADRIIDTYKNESVPIDEWRTPDRAIETLKFYSRFYDLELWKLLYIDSKPQVELSFQIPLGTISLNCPVALLNKTIKNVFVIWTGRIDAIVEWDGQLWIVDHKTSSVMGPSYWEDFKLSQPQQGYTWAATKLLKQRVSGSVINGIFCRKPTKTGTPTEFERQRFIYTDEQLIEWEHNTLILVSDFLSHCVRGYFPMETKQCIGKYGTCQYHPVCTSPLKDRSVILSSSEYKHVTWNPLNQP